MLSFAQLVVFKQLRLTIRDEALRLSDQGHIQAALKHDDAHFNSLFKERWKRFYLKRYDAPLPSATALCPRTVALLQQVPSVRAAMFTLLPATTHAYAVAES